MRTPKETPTPMLALAPVDRPWLPPPGIWLAKEDGDCPDDDPIDDVVVYPKLVVWPILAVAT
jgi:hypothetical protein